MRSLDAPGAGFPDDLVHLNLEADREFIGEDPLDDIAGVDLAENRGEENGVDAGGEGMLLDLGAAPFVVFAAAHDEFDFIEGTEVRDVFHTVASAFAAGRGLEVHDAMDAGIDFRDIMSPLVSMRTVLPASQRAVMRGRTFFWRRGSPPVTSMRGQSKARVSRRMSSRGRFLPS